jgi:hypothetical protein
MKTRITPYAPFGATLALMALMGCNMPAFHREAGDMDTGTFGNATMNNTLLATTPQPAPYSAGKYTMPNAGQKLNGKYAAVIMQTYHTEQSVRLHPSNTSVVSQTGSGQ